MTDIDVYGVGSLTQAVGFLSGSLPLEAVAVNVDDLAEIAFDWLIVPPIIVPPVIGYAVYDSGVAATAGATGAADPVSQGWTASPGVGTNTWADAYDSGNGGWRTVDGTTSVNS